MDKSINKQNLYNNLLKEAIETGNSILISFILSLSDFNFSEWQNQEILLQLY